MHIPLVSTIAVVVFLVLPLAEGVDWSRVLASPPTSRDLNTPNLGSCACDTHVDICDVECCCDPDCGVIATGSTGVFKECIPARDLKSSNVCFQSTSVTQVYRMNNGVGSDMYLDVEDPGDRFVCVYRNNFPDRSTHYSVPDLPVLTSASDASTSDWFQSADTLSYPGFQADDNVPLHTVEKSGSEYVLRRAPSRVIGVSGRGSAGACDGSDSVPFMAADGVRGCTPPLTTPVNETTLCAEYAVPLVLRAIVPPNSPLTSVTGVVPVTTVVFNSVTGESLSSLSDEASALEVFNPIAYFSKVFDGTTDTNSVAQADILAHSTFYDSSSDTCINAATSTFTTIFYSTSTGQDYATIINATVFVFISNITSSDLSGLVKEELVRYVDVAQQQTGSQYSTPMSTGDDGTLYPLSYVAAFGIESLARSGNPGYTKGQRILAGVLRVNGDQQVVEQRSTGLAYPLGSCASGPLVSIPFGHDVEASSCFITLTESELQSMCTVSTYTEGSMTGAAHQLLSIMNRSSVSASSGGIVDVLGVTGDAVDAVISSWVSIENGGDAWAVSSSGTSPLPYSTTERTCSNIITGLKYTISIGRAGSPLDPQDIIVGARIDPVYGSWTYKNIDASTNNFRFTFSVDFDRYIAESEKTQQRRIMAPSVLPGVDEYVFFPFRRPRT